LTDFLAEYEALAAEIAKEARMAEKAFGDRIDALKALTPFYIQKMKGKKPEEDDLPDFNTFASSIHATENDDGSDEPGVRGSRRNGN
jgi:predicted RNA-binding Zn ribbon-like protein